MAVPTRLVLERRPRGFWVSVDEEQVIENAASSADAREPHPSQIVAEIVGKTGDICAKVASGTAHKK